MLSAAMPIYEYRCEDGHHFDVMQKMTDGPVTECEVCGAPVQRVFHPVAVHFKGSGFYNTDYGTRKRARENSENKKSETSSSSSSSGKSEGSTSTSSSSSSSSDSKSSSDTKSSTSKTTSD